MVSIRPPNFSGGLQLNITVDWSTKLLVKFCGADGGSTKKKTQNYFPTIAYKGVFIIFYLCLLLFKFQKQKLDAVLCVCTYVCTTYFWDLSGHGNSRHYSDIRWIQILVLWNVLDMVRRIHHQCLLCKYLVGILNINIYVIAEFRIGKTIFSRHKANNK